MFDDMEWDDFFCFRYKATDEERLSFFTSSSWVEWTLSTGQLIVVLQCGTVHTGVNTPTVTQADSTLTNWKGARPDFEFHLQG